MQQYQGTLTPEMAAEGCNLACENASRLAQDAKILYDAGSYPSAVALAALSIEESGKVYILDHLALAEDDAEAVPAWKRYRRHTEKNVFWSFSSKTQVGLIDAVDKLFSDMDRPQLLDTLKQYSLYSDCIGSGRWVSPSQIPEEIIKPFAEGFIKIVQSHANVGQRSVREMELWVENIRPFKNKSKEILEHAIVEHMRKLQDEGLVPSDIDIDELLIGREENTPEE